MVAAAGDDGVASFVACGTTLLNVRIWPGDPRRAVVVWHGITGTGDDFASLCAALSAAGHYVVAPDSPGCGASDWSGDPAEAYGLTALADLTVTLLGVLGLERVAWLGASKGGGLGIRLAAIAPQRIMALVLCDVGPGLTAPFREALAARLASPPRYPTMAAFRDHIARLLARERLDASDRAIDRLTRAWSRRCDDGSVGYHYDPALARQLTGQPADFDLWPQWDVVGCPTLILRGARSPVLGEAEARVMQERNPLARCAVLPDTGHMTFLETPTQQAAILSFLASALPAARGARP